ncbi:MAG: hypothetical protein N0E59_22175 [Candidatus Thiodiazotropha taylori]|nr:hypothetical protein [Candidatus Thiodiazotropha taylori]MCG8113469.1 hypothetical protein [Candidatus Thiodiazotropha taylori]MCW4285830.1 hypothetical protein [Candidatus Thiodiazotropha taylori]
MAEENEIKLKMMNYFSDRTESIPMSSKPLTGMKCGREVKLTKKWGD